MPVCHCCGEKKVREEFYNVVYFTHYQRHKVQWCRDCQKMYIAYKKDQAIREKIKNLQGSFNVAFE